MKPRWRRISLLYIFIIVAGVILITFVLRMPQQRPEEIPISAVIDMSQDKEIDKLLIEGEWLTVTDSNGQMFKTNIGILNYNDLQELGLNLEGVEFDNQPTGFNWGNMFLTFLPLLLFGGLIFFLFFRARGVNNQAMTFGRSRARLSPGDKPSVTFQDVAGVDEAQQELAEVVDFLKSRERFQGLGARVPRGILLVGPPGTGKTLLARAIAGEAGVPFFSISGSEFVEMFVGVGASRVRDLFDQAKRNTPCIIFIDEIDAVGRHRGAGLGGSHDEREQTLNQILTEMVVLDLPDVGGRVAILKVHSKGKPLAESVNLEVLARETVGFSGADLANLVNEAAILAARRNRKTIEMPEFEESIDRVIAGPERKSKKISPREKEITAYHEAAHALVAKILPNADPPRKISVVARGMALGYTKMLTEDRYLMTPSQFNDMIATLLAGHTAEKLIFNEVSTGAQDDIKRATGFARKMVTDFGMSDKLGPRTFGDKQELVFLGREISEQKDYSDKTADIIDEEIDKIIRSANKVAHKILTENKQKLTLIAERLIAKETLEGEELEALFEEPLPSPEVEIQETPAPAPVANKPKAKAKPRARKAPVIPQLIPKQSPATPD